MEKHMHDHAEMLKAVRHELPKDEMLCDLADLFKLFGDTTRMRILFSLFESEMCVCAIAELLGMTQSAISHQLKVLKQSNLIACRREGKTIYYFLADDHVRTIIGQGFNHLTEERKMKNVKYGNREQNRGSEGMGSARGRSRRRGRGAQTCSCAGSYYPARSRCFLAGYR